MKRKVLLGTFEGTARLLGGLLVFPFSLLVFSSSGKSVWSIAEQASPLVFYTVLLYAISSIFYTIRTASLTDADEFLLKKLRLLKWVLAILTAIIIVLSVWNYYLQTGRFQPGGSNINDNLNYHIKNIGTKLVSPNTGFIIITFLAFYVSQILTISRKLKQEQELTV